VFLPLKGLGKDEIIKETGEPVERSYTSRRTQILSQKKYWALRHEMVRNLALIKVEGG
jgi:hypothetical protein